MEGNIYLPLDISNRNNVRSLQTYSSPKSNKIFPFPSTFLARWQLDIDD